MCVCRGRRGEGRRGRTGLESRGGGQRQEAGGIGREEKINAIIKKDLEREKQKSKIGNGMR